MKTVGFFSELEGNLEKYIEGFFKDKFGGGLQPVDVAKRLAREMRDRRRAGLNEIYVPNRYEIHLNPEDFHSVQPLVDRLSAEMTEFVRVRAAEKNYTLLGPVVVDFREDGEVAAGQLRLESFFDQTTAGHSEGDGTVSEDTLQYTPLRDAHAPGAPQYRHDRKAELVVVEGACGAKRFVINGNLAVIGRREICDIYLPDNSVSRRHAVITRSGGRYLIKDQDSTNGTYVNGVRIKQTELAPGDTIKVGRVVLAFKVE